MTLEETDSPASEYTLGVDGQGQRRIAKDAYEALVQSTNRHAVCELGRKMADLTIQSVFPPESYKVGDDLPGSNQSLGGYLLNNLASTLQFMAFPPGRPILKFEAIEYEVQAQIDEEPELWDRMQLALSRLELSHRKRFQTTHMASTYVEYIKLLLVGGNALWKHLTLDNPTFHRPDCYVVKRMRDGTPLMVIHEEKVSVMALDEDVRDLVEQESDHSEDGLDWWDREAVIYTVQKLKLGGSPQDHSWLYWQETEKGTVIPGTEVETDFETPCMWPGLLIHVPGNDWGRSYCEEYRGDLYTMEALASSINDGASALSWFLMLVKPGSATNIKQVREAPNLSVLPGQEGDITTLRSDKTADLNFVVSHMETVSRRLSRAFLAQSSVQRDGERVTAEEIQRLGGELDRAMGGTYTSISQGSQRTIILRAIALNEEENPGLPPLPKNTISVQVITGQDAMGSNDEERNLRELGKEVAEIFGPEVTSKLFNPLSYIYRLAAAKGIKTDGLIPKPEEFAAQQQADKQNAMASTIVEKGATPAVKGIADAMAQQQQQQPSQ